MNENEWKNQDCCDRQFDTGCSCFRGLRGTSFGIYEWFIGSDTRQRPRQTQRSNVQLRLFADAKPDLHAATPTRMHAESNLHRTCELSTAKSVSIQVQTPEHTSTIVAGGFSRFSPFFDFCTHQAYKALEIHSKSRKNARKVVY